MVQLPVHFVVARRSFLNDGVGSVRRQEQKGGRTVDVDAPPEGILPNGGNKDVLAHEESDGVADVGGHGGKRVVGIERPLDTEGRPGFDILRRRIMLLLRGGAEIIVSRRVRGSRRVDGRRLREAGFGVGGRGVGLLL